jgi:hypothetical protein
LVFIIECRAGDIAVSALDKVAQYFSVSIDQLVHFEDELPQEIEIKDKSTLEQLKLIQELNEDDRNMVFKLIDTFITKKKFKDFFNKNVAAW